MTKIQIRRLSDQKVFDEDTLAELLRSEGIGFDERAGVHLFYDSRTYSGEYENKHRKNHAVWGVNYLTSIASSNMKQLWLDPQKYSIEFSDAIPVEVVKKMVEEIWDHIDDMQYEANARVVGKPDIESIATKYTGK